MSLSPEQIEQQQATLPQVLTSSMALLEGAYKLDATAVREMMQRMSTDGTDMKDVVIEGTLADRTKENQIVSGSKIYVLPVLPPTLGEVTPGHLASQNHKMVRYLSEINRSHSRDGGFRGEFHNYSSSKFSSVAAASIFSGSIAIANTVYATKGISETVEPKYAAPLIALASLKGALAYVKNKSSKIDRKISKRKADAHQRYEETLARMAASSNLIVPIDAE